ncbi:hypothetical protein SAMN05216262_1312 [Colwellia chukchiensis]|uniref:Uncharacterized protein n=1 Tax=Colwellia chukchiensis TaxID=641665 RepID=A0A1H7TYZ0_9GAMM|nr:hypothetical protein [Colwellia chukchiensis]SEL89873.1 hypothetical protein SAMN05216262_1312 [Colwellia chukchiensis]
MSRRDRLAREGKQTNVTKVAEKKNVTTGKSLPLRMTDFEIEQLATLTELVQAELPRKKISRSKVLRALVYLQDPRHVSRIAKSIVENT